MLRIRARHCQLRGDNYVIVDFYYKIRNDRLLLFFSIFTMEDLRRALRKNTSLKENKNDPLSLFAQCQEQLIKLNKQLGVYFTGERIKKVNIVLPSLQNLGKQINELKENISYQSTPEETLCERGSLVQNKQKLLERLKGHSGQIQSLKKKLRLLNINSDQMIRQYEQNKSIIENRANREDIELMIHQSSINDTSRDSLYSDEGKELIKNKSLPSIFSPNRKLTEKSCYRPSLHGENQSKWGKIDQLMSKIVGLNSDGLAQKLLKFAKKEKGGLKTLMKNYQVSEKMKELIKEGEVREEWTRLEMLVAKR